MRAKGARAWGAALALLAAAALGVAGGQRIGSGANLARFGGICFHVDFSYDIDPPFNQEAERETAAALTELARELGVPHRFLVPRGEVGCELDAAGILFVTGEGFSSYDGLEVTARTEVRFVAPEFAGLRNIVVWERSFFVTTRSDAWPELLRADIAKTLAAFAEEWLAGH